MSPKLPAFSVCLAFPAVCSAQEATTYSYDALGRLTTTSVARPQGSVQTAVEYDPAGNRKNYRVTGAKGSSSDPGAGAGAPVTQRIVVVPLNGFTIIPVG